MVGKETTVEKLVSTTSRLGESCIFNQVAETLLSHKVDNVRFGLLTELLDRLGLEDILIQQLTALQFE